MCQLLFYESSGDFTRDEVVDVLEDGVHPGKKVVSGEAWDSPPRGDWRIIQVPGVPAMRFAAMKRVELGPEGALIRRRTQRVNLTGAQRAALDSAKRLVVATEAALAVRDSPARP